MTTNANHEDAFTAWQRANGEHVTEEIDGREVVVERGAKYPSTPADRS